MAVTGKRAAALSDRAVLPALEPPGIEAGKLHRWLGCGRRTTVGASLTARLTALQDEVVDRRLIQPSAVYRFLPIHRIETAFVRLASGDIIHGALFDRKIKGASYIGLAAVHIQAALEEAVHALMQVKKPFTASMLDAIGNTAAEEVADAVLERMKSEAEACGLSISSPLFFGTPGLRLAEQTCMARLLPIDLIGLTLTSAGGLKPVKAFSLIVGVGKNMPTWSKGQACEQCSHFETCVFRQHDS